MKKIKGYIRTKEFNALGITGAKIKRLCDDGRLVRIQHGLYREAGMLVQNQSFIDVCAAYPKAVITGPSALSYYNLTTFIPQSVYMAILRGNNIPKVEYPPIEVYSLSKPFFELGATEVKQGKYSFRIYNMERAVCEAFRYRNKLGIDMAKEALTEYMRRKDKNIAKLYETAEKCKIRKIMEPWMMALV
ncbi:MAG: type IV toxin-antitoxin system AbiEi family antitoxin domain-containing protein [Elusimicrobiota bacterium]|jgi:predicted transcriptional regulator of viral defense system|nr:type IV toxin-antitoxin system AbiEi family antitoxin domain-containing protein [Elusimicrobiota bacterium]